MPLNVGHVLTAVSRGDRVSTKTIPRPPLFLYFCHVVFWHQRVLGAEQVVAPGTNYIAVRAVVAEWKMVSADAASVPLGDGCRMYSSNFVKIFLPFPELLKGDGSAFSRMFLFNPTPRKVKGECALTVHTYAATAVGTIWILFVALFL